jgi:hypothetical protein
MGRVYHERVARRKGSLYYERVMRQMLPLSLFVLWGCSGAASRIEKVPDELGRPRVAAPRVADRHVYGAVAGLRPGQWATYREKDRAFTLAAVAAAGDSLWIEVIEEGEPRQVSARLVGPDGVVKKAYYGEVSKDGSRSTVEPQPLVQNGATATARLNESGRETAEETIVIGGRELKAQRVSLRFEDLEGRLWQEVTLWHKDVPPIYAGSEAGGLVRKMTAKSTVELTAFGTDARPLLEIPR